MHVLSFKYFACMLKNKPTAEVKDGPSFLRPMLFNVKTKRGCGLMPVTKMNFGGPGDQGKESSNISPPKVALQIFTYAQLNRGSDKKESLVSI